MMLLLVGLWFLGVRLSDRYFRGDLRVTFFDVGQGDSALLELPGGRTLLVDGGGGLGSSDMGRSVLFPELTRRGILTVDRMVVTHPDRDHAQGLVGLLEELGAVELWFNGGFLRERGLMQRLRLAALEKNVRERPVDGILRESLSGVDLAWIPLEGEGTNNRSLVLIVDYGPCRMLFTGDIEEKAELALLRQYPLGPVHLLKVAHHGSRTSTSPAFLQRARPLWAVISAGRLNPYGHPHPSVVARLARRGAQVLRTDFHGYLEFRVHRSGRVSCRSALGDCGAAACRLDRGRPTLTPWSSSSLTDPRAKTFPPP